MRSYAIGSSRCISLITYFWAIVARFWTLYSRVVARKDGRSDESCSTAHRDLPSLPRGVCLVVSPVSSLACFTLPGQGGRGGCRQGSERTAPAVLAVRVGARSRAASRRSSSSHTAACSAVSWAACYAAC